MNNHKPARITDIASLVLLISAVSLLAAARMIPGFAQWYSITVYPAVQGSLGCLSGLFPFSLSEVLCFALPLILFSDIVISVLKYKPAAAVIKRVILTVCLLVFLYSANCGVNYYRDSFTDPGIYNNAMFTEEDLASFCEYTAEQLSNIYEEAPAYPNRHELAYEAVTAMEELSECTMETAGNTDGLSGYYPRPKQLTVLSRFFSMIGVSGIYSPFTIEANVNGEMPDLEMPFTSCHELSHLKGYMNEGEANYIGWLACINSSEPSFNRSGWLIAWIYAGNSLYKTNPELYSEIKKKLPDENVLN